MMSWTQVAAVSGFLAVASGAFGAHGLRGRLEPGLMAAFETGAQYHLVHSVALLTVAFYGRATRENVSLPAWLFALGMLIFSGSLYALAITGARQLGLVTPVGGLLLLAAWAATGLRFARR